MLLDELLARYTPFDAHEAVMAAQLRAFLDALPDKSAAFGREIVGVAPNWGHVTGSAWIINRDNTRVVMLHHGKLRKWVQPGGHCDSEGDVLSVARREAQEETGLEVVPVQPGIFDVDAHLIPEYWNTPEHWHFDVRFLFGADDAVTPLVSHESRDVRWVSLAEAAQLNNAPSIGRMIEKTMAFG